MCGMTRIEDINQAIELGVDAIGLIFYSKSPRCLDIEKAKNLLKTLPPFVDAIAVLVNPERLLVQQIINELPIQLLQFHGNESAQFCRQFEKPYIKAIQAKSKEQVQCQTEAQDFALIGALFQRIYRTLLSWQVASMKQT
jgi:phosphoribosylanthranilate isomerase